MLFPLCFSLAVLALAAAVWNDFEGQATPHFSSVLLSVSGLLAVPALGHDLQMVLEHLGTGAVLLGVGLLLCGLRVWGVGQALLLAAAGCWAGPLQTPLLLGWVAVCGGALLLSALLLRLVSLLRLPSGMPRPLSGGSLVLTLHAPYSLAVSGAMVAVLLPLLRLYFAGGALP